MNIALGFDKRYCRHALATILSVIKNTNEKIQFYLLTDKSLNFLDKAILRKVIETNCHDVKFVDMDKKFQSLYTGAWSKAMYYPILLCDIVEDKKVLFLDCDVIVNGDIKELYNTDIQDVYCAVVHDFPMDGVIKKNRKMKMSLSKKKIPMAEYFRDIRGWSSEDIKRYFNSGMLLMNLDNIRKDNCKERMLEILEKENLACPDQDCFNICFHDNIKILPIKYNLMITDEAAYNDLDFEVKEEYDAYVKNRTKAPLVIHFITKPWRGKKVDLGDLYFKYEKMAPLIFRILNPNIDFKVIKRSILAVRNYYANDKKRKMLVVLGFEFKF